MTTSNASRAWAFGAAILLLATGLAFTPVAEAGPCRSSHADGIGPNVGCRHGADLRKADLATHLDAGSFFGIKTWALSGYVKGDTRQGIIELVTGVLKRIANLGSGVKKNGKIKKAKKPKKLKSWKGDDHKWGDKWYAKRFGHKRWKKRPDGGPNGGSEPPIGGGGSSPTYVSEPAAFALMLGGLGIGALVLRRRLMG